MDRHPTHGDRQSANTPTHSSASFPTRATRATHKAAAGVAARRRERAEAGAEPARAGEVAGSPDACVARGDAKRAAGADGAYTLTAAQPSAPGAYPRATTTSVGSPRNLSANVDAALLVTAPREHPMP